MNNFYVYAYLREDSTPYYIGKGKCNRAYLNGRIPPKPTDHTRIEIIKDNLTENDAFNLECKLNAHYGRKDLGTGILRNLTNGGEGVSGRIIKEETIQKRITKNTGKKRTPDQCLRMSLAQKGKQPKQYTKEEKDQISKKISKAHKGKPKSNDHKENLSKSLMGKYKGVPKSEETKQKMRKPKSEEHRKAISEARIAKYKALKESKT